MFLCLAAGRKLLMGGVFPPYLPLLRECLCRR